MRKRINITLPTETVALLDRVTDNRSRFIEDAIRCYVKDTSEENLRARLAKGYVRRADSDVRLAEEWFHLEEETWQDSK